MRQRKAADLRTAGRRPGGSSTRSAVVDAARALFAERGLVGTTVRAIAERAGVSPGMVHHFATKVDLFVASLAMPLNPAEELPRLRDAGPRTELGERIVRFFVQTWRTFVEQVMLPRASTLFEARPERLAAALSHLLGWALLATVVEAEPLASLDEDQLVRLIAPALQLQLDG